MKGLQLSVLSSLVGVISILSAEKAQAGYDDAWAFTCSWECGEAMFEPEYGGYTVNGYASEFHPELPDSEWEAYSWAYYDYWLPAGCDRFSSTFAQTVCMDTAFLHGLSAWEYFESLYASYPEEVMACEIINERAAWRNPYAPYTIGWFNRDADLAALGNCWS